MTIARFVIFTSYYSTDQVSENKMCRARVVICLYGERREAYGGKGYENLKKRNHLDSMGVDRRAIN